MATDQIDGSILYSAYFHFLKATGGDLFGLGSGTEYLDLFNNNSAMAQNLLLSFGDYTYQDVGDGNGFSNAYDKSDASWFNSLTENQRWSVSLAYMNLWWLNSDDEHTLDFNDKVLGFLPWNARVIINADGKEVYVSHADRIRYFDPLSGEPLRMKIRTVFILTSASVATYFAYRLIKWKYYSA
jgi:hypothetical protein